MSRRYAGVAVLIALLGSAILVACRERLGEGRMRGALLGTAIAALAAICGVGLLDWSWERGPRQFFGAMVGGILGRLTIFGAVLMLIAFQAPHEYDVVATALSLLGFYVVFQALEVRFVLQRLKEKRP